MINSLGFLNDRRRLERTLGTNVEELHRIAYAARSYYREKEEWTKGKQRRLLVPSYQLKLIQIRFYRHALRCLTPHTAAYSVRGRGTQRAAEQHVGNWWFYHRDIKDFYPSIRTSVVQERFVDLRVEKDTAELLAHLVTVEDQLPQGAPTSPAIGNIVLWRLDNRITRLIEGHKLVYTRYMDDITVSGGQHLQDRFAPLIDKTIIDCGWRLNSKGGLSGPRDRHAMLGLVVNQRLNVPDAKHARIKQILSLAEKGHITLTDTEFNSIRGSINWIMGVNRSIGSKLLMRYERLLSKTDQQ